VGASMLLSQAGESERFGSRTRDPGLAMYVLSAGCLPWRCTGSRG
jgi:hypothetical protein